MVTARKSHLAAFLVGLAAVNFAIPASAQTRSDAFSANEHTAIHECSTRASKYKEDSQENEHLYTFRTCMYEHGARGD